MIGIEQCRGARGILGWTQQNLADASGLSKTAINNFEKGHSDIKNDSLHAIKNAFICGGIEFIGQDGIRKKSEDTKILHGQNGFLTFYDDILTSIEQTQKELLVFNCDREHLSDSLSEAKKEQRDIILKNNPVPQRFLCTPNNIDRPVPGREYRLLPDYADDLCIPACIYGTSKVAFGVQKKSYIIIIDSPAIHAAETERFNRIWKTARKVDAKKAP